MNALILRQIYRSWLRRRAGIAVTVMMLSIAIASATSLFTVFDAALLNSLPFRDPEQLIVVRLQNQRGSVGDDGLSLETVRQLERSRPSTVERITAIGESSMSDSARTPSIRGVF